MNLDDIKQLACEEIERQGERLIGVAKDILDSPEPGASQRLFGNQGVRIGGRQGRISNYSRSGSNTAAHPFREVHLKRNNVSDRT